MLGLVQIQIWLESPAVLILGSKPSVDLAATNSTTTSSLHIDLLALYVTVLIVWKDG
jgi:hypothetical protein